MDKVGLQINAVLKIQRGFRSRMAKRIAEEQLQWNLFAELDTQDEAEMLHLAVFMQTLLDTVPVPEEETTKRLAALSVTDETADQGDSKKPKEVTAADIVKATDAEYEIKASTITPEIAHEIVEVYRNGGRLSREAVVKVLKRVYKMFKTKPPITNMYASQGCKVIAVGDLHGQLPDLLHILDDAGMPSEKNMYIFNGDFVDRGPKGLEIMVILFALYAAHGDQVVALNRGNHEDMPVCRVYGFEAEVKEKYDELLFEMIAEVFNHLPLFVVLNSTVFVVHGGLFHDADVQLSDLNEIDRTKFAPKPPVGYPENTYGLPPEGVRAEYLHQLQREALWSDPGEKDGCHTSQRGVGKVFGPDIANKFMAKNGLSMVVRSHECVRTGFCLPYAETVAAQTLNSKSFVSVNIFGHRTSSKAINTNAETLKSNSERETDNPPGYPLLCTLFSASNYGGGNNEGAYITFMPDPFPGSVVACGEPAKPKSGLGIRRGSATGKPAAPPMHYAVHHYKCSEADVDEIHESNNAMLTDLIIKRKAALTKAFEEADTKHIGLVTRLQWSDVMTSVTGITIRWLSIISQIAPEECLSASSVEYHTFLRSFTLKNKMQVKPNGEMINVRFSRSRSGSEAGKPDGEAHTEDHKDISPDQMCDIADGMYGMRKQLENVFRYFDTNNDGVISLEELHEGCAKLNKLLHPDLHLNNLESILKQLDYDDSGTIDIHEFFEAFRMLDAKDGKEDGVISIAKNAKSSLPKPSGGAQSLLSQDSLSRGQNFPCPPQASPSATPPKPPV